MRRSEVITRGTNSGIGRQRKQDVRHTAAGFNMCKQPRGGCGVGAGPKSGMKECSSGRQRNVSSGSCPPLSGISIHQLFLAVYKLSAYPFWVLRLCKSSIFPPLLLLLFFVFLLGLVQSPGGKPAETPEGFCFCSPRFVRVRHTKNHKSRREKFVSLCIWSVWQQTGLAPALIRPFRRCGRRPSRAGRRGEREGIEPGSWCK